MVVKTQENKVLLLIIAALAALAFTMFWTMITKTWDELRTLRENYNSLSYKVVKIEANIKNICISDKAIRNRDE